jgi:hypothetical protein
MGCNHWFSFSGTIPLPELPRSQIAVYGPLNEYTLTEPFGQC